MMGSRGHEGHRRNQWATTERDGAYRPTVVITASQGRLDELVRSLEALGCQVLRKPLVASRTRLDSDTRQAARSLLNLPWLLLTSQATVSAFEELDLGLSGPLVGAVGPATAEAAKRAGGDVVVIGAPATAEGLAKAFLAHPEARGPVGLPRGSRALRTLDERLADDNIVTVPVVVYESVDLPWEDSPADLIVLASPSAAAALPESAGRASKLIAIGETTAAAVQARGWHCFQAHEPTPGAITSLIGELLG